MPEELDDPRAAQAAALAAQGRWREAATTWEELAAEPLALPQAAAERAAETATETAAQTAAQLWSLAAEAWRREDAPAASARALRQALARTPAGPGRALLLVQLAAALSDAGQHAPACDLAAQAEAAACTRNERQLALDLGAGLATLSCDWPEASRRVAALELPVARAFRAACLARAQGQLAEAGEALSQAERLCDPGEASAGLRARLAAERAELALEAGRPPAALAAALEARRIWTRLGRRGALFAVVATELRVRLALGQLPIEAELNRALRFAEERGLHPLRLELLLARGLARRSRGDAAGALDLEEALALAQAIGAELAISRVRGARVSGMSEGNTGR